MAAFYKWWCGSGPPGLNLLGWWFCVWFVLLARFMAIASFATWFESSENRLGFLLSVVVGLRLRVSVLAHRSRTEIMHNKHLKLGMIYLIMLPALVNIVLLPLVRSSKSDIFVIYRSSISVVLIYIQRDKIKVMSLPWRIAKQLLRTYC